MFVPSDTLAASAALQMPQVYVSVSTFSSRCKHVTPQRVHTPFFQFVLLICQHVLPQAQSAQSVSPLPLAIYVCVWAMMV